MCWTPGTSSYDWQLLIQHIIQINDAANVRMLAGDFNLPHIDWLNSACTKLDGISDTFQEALDDLRFFQLSQSAYNDKILDLTLFSYNNRLIECRNLAPITTLDPHQDIWLEVKFDICAQQSSCPNVLSDNADMTLIDVQLSATLLASVNWRNIFANDKYVDD